MKNIKEIVCENLIALRKNHGLTQIDLSKKINYSDKAVSRWENGEVMPDYEILQSICNVYNVPITYLFEEHKEVGVTGRDLSNKVAITALIVCFVWTIITVYYLYQKVVVGTNPWTLFVLGVPISAVAVMYCNRRYLKNKMIHLGALSALLWSTLAYIYVLNLSLNMWPIFFAGIPAEAAVVISSFIKKK